METKPNKKANAARKNDANSIDANLASVFAANEEMESRPHWSYIWRQRKIWPYTGYPLYKTGILCLLNGKPVETLKVPNQVEFYW